MRLRNTKLAYGAIARWIHWSMAIAIIAMFALGIWMRQLGYYDAWYTKAPDIHRSVGIVLLVALVIRLVWRLTNPSPSNDQLPRAERIAASTTHWIFYVLLFVLMLAGYLISTADGRSIDVFGLVTVPSMYEQKGLEQLAGIAHEYLAYALMALVAVHAIAALKHHFIDKDKTLTRMWRAIDQPKSSIP
ncbi:MAG: cytochrome b [Pseudomonadota bacterium]